MSNIDTNSSRRLRIFSSIGIFSKTSGWKIVFFTCFLIALLSKNEPSSTMKDGSITIWGGYKVGAIAAPKIMWHSIPIFSCRLDPKSCLYFKNADIDLRLHYANISTWSKNWKTEHGSHEIPSGTSCGPL